MKMKRIAVIFSFDSSVVDRYGHPLIQLFDITNGEKLVGYKVDGKRPMLAKIIFYGNEIEYNDLHLKRVKDTIHKSISLALHPSGKIDFGDTVYFLCKKAINE